jgi:TRAP-type uncharacterized transport system substrate-binding protein
MIKYTPLLFCFNVFADITIASGSREGLYHTLATEHCREFKEPCKVIETSGTLENIDLVKSGEVDYAVIQDNIGFNGLTVLKTFHQTERLNIFYKGKATSFEEVASKKYSIDKNSGTYALIYAIHKALGLQMKYQSNNLDIAIKQKEKPSFCERETEASFYNIAVDSLPYKKMQIEFVDCDIQEYQFTLKEIDILRSQLPLLQIQNGYIENGIVLVRKA